MWNLCSLFKAVLCNYFLLYLLKLSLWSDSGFFTQLTCIFFYCLWVHHSQINTTNQSQRECLRSVNHSCAYTAGSPPSLTQPVLCSALPPRRCDACSYLVRYIQTQTVYNGGKATELKMPHHCPRQREEIRRQTKKSSVNTQNWMEPERKLR